MSDIVPWVAAADLTCTPSGVDADVVAKAATLIAEMLCGHQYGVRTLRLRPKALTAECRCGVGCGCAGGFCSHIVWWPYSDGQWLGCSCGRGTQIIITEHVNSITSVKADGVLLDAADWTLYGDNRLVRTDGGTFPCCQDLHHDPDSDFGTLEVLCEIGSPPDEAGILAVQEIACEIGNVFDTPEACRLPKKVQSMTRQQLSVNFVDPSQVLANGFVGLPFVDLWLGALDMDSRRRGGRAIDLTRQTAWRAPESTS